MTKRFLWFLGGSKGAGDLRGEGLESGLLASNPVVNLSFMKKNCKGIYILGHVRENAGLGGLAPELAH